MLEKHKITLKNMVFSASVGVAEWEHRVPATLEVDLEIEADLGNACTTDDLHDTIDYSEMYDVVGETIRSRHYNLIESLARAIADGVAQRHECRSVTVRIRKLHPPVKGVCDFAEVELIRYGTNSE